MQFKFSDLKSKDVINIIDGKHLGKVCDISFTFPENNVLGFTVTGCKGFKFSKQEVFLPVNCIVKIGADAILVKYGKEEPEDCVPEKPHKPPKRPPECPPPCPPCPPQYCPPNNCPPQNCPPQNCPPNSRRSFDEYE